MDLKMCIENIFSQLMLLQRKYDIYLCWKATIDGVTMSLTLTCVGDITNWTWS